MDLAKVRTMQIIAMRNKNELKFLASNKGRKRVTHYTVNSPEVRAMNKPAKNE